jgi:hypothetical protein
MNVELALALLLALVLLGCEAFYHSGSCNARRDSVVAWATKKHKAKVAAKSEAAKAPRVTADSNVSVKLVPGFIAATITSSIAGASALWLYCWRLSLVLA